MVANARCSDTRVKSNQCCFDCIQIDQSHATLFVRLSVDQPPCSFVLIRDACYRLSLPLVRVALRAPQPRESFCALSRALVIALSSCHMASRRRYTKILAALAQPLGLAPVPR